ncbi:MAG: DUF2853 family protein [Pararhodobacter sp.]|nr:DUF2853 family protein [Pararhodobacter sp.]
MGRRDELVQRYADDLRSKCGVEPDMDLLTKITIGCGPAIYDAKAAKIATGQPRELDALKSGYLIKKLGLTDGPHLDAAISAAIGIYGQSEHSTYRPVVHYLLCKHFGKEGVYA